MLVPGSVRLLGGPLDFQISPQMQNPQVTMMVVVVIISGDGAGGAGDGQAAAGDGVLVVVVRPRCCTYTA